MNNSVKDRHTLILKSKDRKSIFICVDFLIHDVGVTIQCTADKYYSVDFYLHGIDFHLTDGSTMNFSTEIGRDVWKTLTKHFDFEHNCKSHCDSNIARTKVCN